MERRSFLKGLLASLVLPRVKLPGINGLYPKFFKREDQSIIINALWSSRIKELLLEDLKTLESMNVITGRDDDVEETVRTEQLSREHT